jgi:hypothetical protein
VSLSHSTKSGTTVAVEQSDLVFYSTVITVKHPFASSTHRAFEQMVDY